MSRISNEEADALWGRTPEEHCVVVAAVGELKRAIQTAVSEAVCRFQSHTGLTPSAIAIDMLDVTTISDAVKRHVIGEVKVEIGL